MEPHIDFMDPLTDSTYTFHGSPYIFAGDYMDALIDHMDPLTDYVDALIDFPFRCHGSPYTFA